MKKIYTRILFSILMLLSCKITFSQFSIEGEFRPRFEVRNGYKQLLGENDNPAVFVSQRSRITLLYKTNKFDVGFAFQDVRVWGDETLFSSTGVFGDQASLDVNEAWIKIPFLRNSSVTIGRQYFKYDDGRILAGRNWNQHSLAYDALLYAYRKNNFKVDMALSWNNNKEYLTGIEYTSGKMKTLNFIHLQKDFSPGFRVSALALASGFNKNDISETLYLRGTYGLHLRYMQNGYDATASAYYQNGTNKDGQQITAYLLHLKLGYSWEKIGLLAGYTTISGNKPGTEKDELFDLLYGGRHNYYGLMDYFSNMPKGTQNGGLQDVFGTIFYQAFPFLKLSVDYHYFLNQQKVINQLINSPASYMNKSLGQEIDIYFSANIMDYVNLKGGYSYLIPTTTLESIGGFESGEKSHASWVWMMLTVKPTLFSTSDR